MRSYPAISLLVFGIFSVARAEDVDVNRRFPENYFKVPTTKVNVTRGGTSRKGHVLFVDDDRVTISGSDLVWKTTLDLRGAEVQCPPGGCKPPKLVLRMKSLEHAVLFGKLYGGKCGEGAGGEFELEALPVIDTQGALLSAEVNLGEDEVQTVLLDGVVDNDEHSPLKSPASLSATLDKAAEIFKNCR